VLSSHPFDADTAVEPLTDGLFAATVTDRWNALGERPNGGYLVSLCLRALAGVLPFPDPLVVSAYYLRPGVVGRAEVRTEVVRIGRTMATGEARLVSGGKEIVRAVASFADLGQVSGRTLVLNEPPDLPPPHECVDPYEGRHLPGVTIADRVELRTAKPAGWAQGLPTGQPTAEFWMRFAGGRDADALALPGLVDAVAPVVLELGEIGSSTVELTVHVRARPAAGWLACRVSTRHVIDGFHEEDFEVWDSAGRLVAQSRQLALLPRGNTRGNS
jgi:acyl-CoA thioesterase